MEIVLCYLIRNTRNTHPSQGYLMVAMIAAGTQEEARPVPTAHRLPHGFRA